MSHPRLAKHGISQNTTMGYCTEERTVSSHWCLAFLRSQQGSTFSCRGSSPPAQLHGANLNPCRELKPSWSPPATLWSRRERQKPLNSVASCTRRKDKKGCALRLFPLGTSWRKSTAFVKPLDPILRFTCLDTIPFRNRLALLLSIYNYYCAP